MKERKHRRGHRGILDSREGGEDGPEHDRGALRRHGHPNLAADRLLGPTNLKSSGNVCSLARSLFVKARGSLQW